MTTVKDHHTGPVLPRIVDVIVFYRSAHVLPGVVSFVVVLYDLNGHVWVEKVDEVVNVTIDDHVTINEYGGPDEAVKVRYEVPAEDKGVSPILLSVKATKHGLMEWCKTDWTARVLDD